MSEGSAATTRVFLLLWNGFHVVLRLSSFVKIQYETSLNEVLAQPRLSKKTPIYLFAVAMEDLLVYCKT